MERQYNHGNVVIKQSPDSESPNPLHNHTHIRDEGNALKDGSFSFQRVLGDLLLGGGTISRSLKPIPASKIISDKKPLSLQFL